MEIVPILGIMVPICALMIPIVAILTSHQQKMAKIVHESHAAAGNSAQLEEMKREIQALKEIVHQQVPLSGFWKGQALVVNQGLCTLNLEMRDTDAPANYIGYSTLSCATPPSLWGLKGGQQLPPAMREQMLPTAIVMTGTPVNGAIRFQVNRTVVSPASGCETTSYTVTPFGTNRVAVQWLDGLCLGGQILMTRIGR